MRLLTTLLLLVAPSFAALNPEQKVFDFTVLAQTLATNYGPYHWKAKAFNFDAMDVKPWLARVEATKDDIEFLEVLVDYAASLRDGHVSLSFNSEFRATLGFTTDLYATRVLIDSIDRDILPRSFFPAAVGDELVSLDGVPVNQLVGQFSKYNSTGNPRATRRLAASMIPERAQSKIPAAANIGDSAEVEVRRAVNGALEKYTIPWVTIGVPFTDLGRVPAVPTKANPDPRQLAVAEKWLPPYIRPLAPLMSARLPQRFDGVLNIGSEQPVYSPPPGSRLRLAGGDDFFVSATYVAEGKTIGWIRIPSFSPLDIDQAIATFDREIAFMHANTSGLVIDLMRNPGGDIFFYEALTQRLIPHPFRVIGYEIRATQPIVQYFANALSQAQASGVEPWILQHLADNYKDMLQANREGGNTGSIAFNETGSLIRLPAPVVYRKPLIVLVDDLSASSADAFPAVIQDNRRGKIVGTRTMGAGGNVVPFSATVFSNLSISVTRSLMTRREPIVTAEYPTAPYIENIGVRPDIELDYMTRENLMNRGTPFVNAFTRILLDQIGN
jgi:hypothetical protein